MARRVRTFSVSGFSVVELLIVVSVAGLLAALAVPSYTKYKDRAHQAEAKSELASIYAVEKSYGVANNTYTACLAQIGYAPGGNEKYYTSGYDSGVISGVNNCGPGGGKPCMRYVWTTNSGSTCAATDTYVLADLRMNQALALPNQTNLGTSPGDVSRNGFTAAAVGNIGRAVSSWDRWKITDGKVLTNPAVGY